MFNLQQDKLIKNAISKRDTIHFTYLKYYALSLFTINNYEKNRIRLNKMKTRLTCTYIAGSKCYQFI